MTVACVWTERNQGQGGSVYNSQWVRKLKAGVLAQAPYARFECLSDWTLDHDFPGWWAKIELFKPGRFVGPVLFMDLDTLVVGSLKNLLGYRGEFAICRDFYHPTRMQSCVMAWTPGPHTASIYDRFTSDPHRWMRKFRSDQEFIEDTLLREVGLVPDYWQDLHPGEVVSLKVHAREACPDDAALVCGHGEPRLSDPVAGWAHERWEVL